MLSQKLKLLLNGGAAKAGPEGLQLEINGLEAEKKAVRAELMQVPARRAELAMFAENDRAIDELEERERQLYRDLERLDLQIAALAGRLTEQRNLKRAKRIEFHRAALRSAAKILGAAVEQAIVANEAAVAAFDAATREIGETDSYGLFERIHFGGLLTRECQHLWEANAFAVESKSTATAPVQSPRPIKAADYSRVGTPRAVRLTDFESPRPKAERPPRVLPEIVPPGHVRVRVLRNGYEAPTGEQLTYGDDVDLPAHIATEAARNGAVTPLLVNQK